MSLSIQRLVAVSEETFAVSPRLQYLRRNILATLEVLNEASFALLR
jgi:hypothetical protein